MVKSCYLSSALVALNDYFSSAIEAKTRVTLKKCLFDLIDASCSDVRWLDRLLCFLSAAPAQIKSGLPLYGASTTVDTLISMASQLGICYDVFLLGPDSADFQAHLFSRLTLATGGRLFWHHLSGERATIASDIFRHVSGPLGFNGLLRIRTSGAFMLASAHGPLVADRTYPDLFHMYGCDSSQCVSFDFQFSSNSGGFDIDSYSGNSGLPFVQVAFAYTVWTPTGLRRFLRVHTYQFPVTESPLEMFLSADANAVAALLVQHVVRISEEKGVPEAGRFLRDWFVHVASLHAVAIARHRNRGISAPKAAKADVEFGSTPALKVGRTGVILVLLVIN